MTVQPHTSPLDRAPHAIFRAQVQQITHLSERYMRITFTGNDLDTFGALGSDQHVHLVFPSQTPVTTQGTVVCETCGIGVGKDAGTPQLDGHVRAYTVRRASSILRIIDIDFVLHKNGGPASSWAARARVGDALDILAPTTTARAQISWQPGNARKLLLIGDETAVPAISAITSGLPPDLRVEALVEVPTGTDIVPIHAGPHVAVHWVARQRENELTPSARGQQLRGEVAQWLLNLGQLGHSYSHDSPYYVWIAGNHDLVTHIESDLRKHTLMSSAVMTPQSYWQ